MNIYSGSINREVMKKITLIIFSVFIAFYLSACDDGLVEEVNEGVMQSDDENVTVVIDEIKRTDQIPNDVLEKISGEPPTLTQGNIFACVYFNVDRVDDIYLRGFNESALFDEQGNSYQKTFISVVGYFKDPDDFLAGQLPYIYEGADGVILYEIPEQVKPVEIVLDYLYSITEDGDLENSKKIMIPLSNLNQ